MSVGGHRLWIFAAIVVLAAALRLPALDVRPMHADEAVHAAKFARLLEQGLYEYDPEEFHGPTLNYLTLIPARVRGLTRYADLDEVTLRSVPAFGGILLVAAHVLLVPVVGFRPAALAALFAAVSPAMVYYSRYYIQETLLVAFSFGALVSICRYLQKPRAGWAIAAGASVGLMAATKETWVTRAGGASWHVHPWHYYVGLLLFSGSDGGPIWTEAAILGLALVGLVAAFAGGRVTGGRGRLLAFLGGYAVLLAVTYASIPYKTPWCVLGFLHALILLGGVGGARLLEISPARVARPLVAAILAAAAAHLGWLAWAGSVRFSSDPRNPWVYAHTGTGVFEIARRVNVLSRAHPLHAMMPIEVISGQNLWPLPWYLRRSPAVRWETVPVNDGVHAPVILATPDMEDAIRQKLYEWRRPGERGLYIPIFDAPVELRPRVEVRGYAAKFLWDRTVAR